MRKRMKFSNGADVTSRHMWYLDYIHSLQRHFFSYFPKYIQGKKISCKKSLQFSSEWLRNLWKVKETGKELCGEVRMLSPNIFNGLTQRPFHNLHHPRLLYTHAKRKSCCYIFPWCYVSSWYSHKKISVISFLFWKSTKSPCFQITCLSYNRNFRMVCKDAFLTNCHPRKSDFFL